MIQSKALPDVVNGLSYDVTITAGEEAPQPSRRPGAPA